MLGRFSKDFHFIDAKDEPPTYCGVDFERDCKEDGCVVSAIKNYTEQLLDENLVDYRRSQAAKFVVHFIGKILVVPLIELADTNRLSGDIHQPLHAENVAQVRFLLPPVFSGESRIRFIAAFYY